MDVAAAFRMAGKVAVVTGGGSGIGAACAAVLAGAGARVVVADIDLAGAERVAAAIGAAGGDAVPAAVDVTDRAAMADLVATTVAHFEHVDVLVNNAGIMRRRALLDVSAEEFDQMLAANLASVLYGTQAAARVMRPGSAIVNTLSTIIDLARPGTGSYAATKKGVEALTRTFAVELGPAGIRVNGIAPGWTATGMTRSAAVDDRGAFDQAAFDERTRRMAAASPMSGVAEPSDSAYAVLYLASPASRFVTGQIIRVDGGASLT